MASQIINTVGLSAVLLQGYGSMRCGPPDTGVCAPLEYDEPDAAPDFDDGERDDDEYGPMDVLAESIRAAGIEPRPA